MNDSTVPTTNPHETISSSESYAPNPRTIQNHPIHRRAIITFSIKHLPDPDDPLGRNLAPRWTDRLPPSHPRVILLSMISALFDQKFRRVPCAETARVLKENLCLFGVHFAEDDNVVWIRLYSS